MTLLPTDGFGQGSVTLSTTLAQSNIAVTQLCLWLQNKLPYPLDMRDLGDDTGLNQSRLFLLFFALVPFFSSMLYNGHF
jgi:hypothetical protein